MVLWRWAKPSTRFVPELNWIIKQRGISLSSHKKIVYASLKPTDWMKIKGGSDIVLHKIILSKEQAQLCVVAEALFRPSDEKIKEFVKKRNIYLAGSYKKFTDENYEKSFIPLLEYKEGHNLPEVLIPFPVDAKICWLRTKLLHLHELIISFLKRFSRMV